MTVATLVSSDSWVSAGTLAPRSIPFPFIDLDDLRATYTPLGGAAQQLVRGTHYTITGNNRAGTAVFTPLLVFVAGGTFRTVRQTRALQEYETERSTPLDAESIERELDRQAMRNQEQDRRDIEIETRAPLVPPGQAAPMLDIEGIQDGELLQYSGGKLVRVPKAPFAGKIYGGDATGRPVPISGTGADAALRTDLASTVAGAALVGWIGLRFGATYRTVMARLRDWDTVKDFGAIGDEVANDFEAFEKAIAGVPSGATIYVPPGRYYMSSAAQTLLVDRDISLVGAGEGASVLIFEHSVPGTDAITIGNVDETRVGIRIEYIGIQFKNGNTRDVIRTESFMSKFTLNHLDIRSYNTSFAFRASGAAIRIGGVGTVGGLNDWLLIQHCYLALCTYGIVATGRNSINARITQNTCASIWFESLFWTTGGQSIIDNNTFQYSNLGADGSRKFYTVVLDGGSPSDVNNITFGPGNSFQANGGAGLGPAVIRTWEILVKDATSVNIVGNQFAGASNTVNFGAFHAIEFINSNGWVEKNTWEGYSRTATGDNDPGPCQYDSTSRVSHINNINGDFTLGAPDFTSASATAALVTIASGTLRLEQKSTIPFFEANAVSGITDVNFLRVGGSGNQTIGNIAAGVAQMSGGSATVSLSWSTPSIKVFPVLATGSTPTEYLGVEPFNGNFVVKSSNVSSSSYFMWLAIGP